MIVCGSEVRRIRGVRYYFPSELLQSLAGDLCDVWFCIVDQKSNFPPSWTLVAQSIPQLLQLLTVEVGCHTGVWWKQLEVDHALKIPPNREHLLLWVKVTFWLRFRLCITGHPLAFAGMVNI
jgi:hypothetical protein